MPRRKQKYRESLRLAASAPTPKGRSDRNQIIANFWTARIRAGLKAKEQYSATAREVVDYFKANHQTLFEDPATRQHFMDFRGSAAISVPKIAQMRNSLGPRLYMAKPVRTITPMTDDGVMRGLALVLRAYLNYTVRESKFAKQMRKAIDDSLLRGRGLLQQVWDPIRQIVTSEYVSSKDFIFDPDYEEIENAKWIAIRYREPFWETERRIQDQWRLEDLKPKTQVQDESKAVKDNSYDDPKNPDAPKVAKSNDTLEYWVVLSKMGYGFRGSGVEGAERFKDDQDYCRLEIVLDHGVPIAEGEWEVPLYLDRDWPISHCDMIETIDSGWPESISGQVLPCQKGVDLYTSLNLTSNKNRNRMIMFVDSECFDKAAHNQLRNGTSADMIVANLRPGYKLTDAVHVPQFGQGSTLESANERAFLLEQIEATTGVTTALHGGEEQAAKDRSATATQTRVSAAQDRVADLKQKVEELATDTARKEAIATRLLLDAEDVSRIVRPSQIGLYYVKVETAGGVVVPVRDTRPEAERENARKKPGPLTLEDIDPAASTYFDAPEQAQEACFALWNEMQMTEDPRIVELAAELGQEIAEEDGLPVGISFDLVSVDRVWEDTAGITPEELMRELSYEIQTGSGQKVDKAAEQANAEALVQTALPAALGMGDIGAANAILEIRDEAHEVPPEKRVRFSPPPAPEQQESKGKDEDKGGGE